METIGGVPVTDEMIQALADEAERGYDVGALRKRGRMPEGKGSSNSPSSPSTPATAWSSTR